MSRSSQLSTFDHEKEKFQNEYNENLKIRENLLSIKWVKFDEKIIFISFVILIFFEFVVDNSFIP